MEEISIDNAPEILSYFRPSNKEWIDLKWIKTNPYDLVYWIFRGQKEATYSLLPSAHRKPYEEYIWNPPEQVEYDPDKKDEYEDRQIPASPEYFKKLFVLRFISCELEVVKNFLQLADKLGIPTSLTTEIKIEIEKFILRVNDHYTFTNPPDYLLKNNNGRFPPEQFHAAFALAQHHGIPTRFLDWTVNPLIALFFPCYEIWNDNKDNFDITSKMWGKSNDVNNCFAVWALNTYPFTNMYERNIDLEIVRVPYYGNSYLKSQSGVFTVLPFANKDYIKQQMWPDQKSFLEKTKVNFKKILINKSLVKEILKLLYFEGIHPASLMPTLDNVTKDYKYFQQLFKKEGGSAG